MSQFRGCACRIAFFVALAAATAAVARPHGEVTVESGKLKGVYHFDYSVPIFKVVPFAASPVGDLRWKAPEPAKKWPGVRAADKFGPACMQTDVFGDILQFMRDAQPSEDCLNLAIWLPASVTTKSKLPVFVWYYGGG